MSQNSHASKLGNKSMSMPEEENSPTPKVSYTVVEDKDESTKFTIPMFQVKNLKKFGASTSKRSKVCKSFREYNQPTSLVKENTTSTFAKYLNPVSRQQLKYKRAVNRCKVLKTPALTNRLRGEDSIIYEESKNEAPKTAHKLPAHNSSKSVYDMSETLTKQLKKKVTKSFYN